MFRLIIVISNESHGQTRQMQKGAMLGRPACGAGSSRRKGPDGAAHLISIADSRHERRPPAATARSSARAAAAPPRARRLWSSAQRSVYGAPPARWEHSALCLRVPPARAQPQADGRAKYSRAAFPLHYGIPPAEQHSESAGGQPLASSGVCTYICNTHGAIARCAPLYCLINQRRIQMYFGGDLDAI